MNRLSDAELHYIEHDLHEGNVVDNGDVQRLLDEVIERRRISKGVLVADVLGRFLRKLTGLSLLRLTIVENSRLLRLCAWVRLSLAAPTAQGLNAKFNAFLSEKSWITP